MNVRIKEGDLRVRLLSEEISGLLAGEEKEVALPLGPDDGERVVFRLLCGPEHPATGEELEWIGQGLEILIRVSPAALERISDGEEDTISLQAGRMRVSVQRDLKPRRARGG